MREESYYNRIGFKCGLEIHQRLATKTKLFCSCNAQLPADVSIAEIERRQRAVAGELGRIDASATFETVRGRKFIYNAFRNTTCLVDLDEEPPHDLNREALAIALQVAAELDATVSSELEPMRKEVIDGSDPSAFQRTLLVGSDGHIMVNGKKIIIIGVFLEEESSGIEYSDSSVVVYNVDRLGVPLIEIDTAPVIKTPEEAKAVAEKIGLMLRLTGKVQRGIGSIRQDVNVSIREGARVEIKGFQDLDTMDKIIEREVERQQRLIEIKKLLQKRKAKAHNAKDVSETLKGTNARIIKQQMENNGTVFAARLEGFEGMLGYEINPDKRFGSEISDYAKLAGVGGIIHSDENLGQYGFSDLEISSLRRILGIEKGDAFILVSGPKEMCSTAIGLAIQRAEYAMKGVPNESRGVDNKLLITTFLRPLPGGSRMYPETDARPVLVDAGDYDLFKKNATDSDKLAKWLENEIGNKQLAEQMLWSQYLPLFREVVKRTRVSGSVVAPILLEKTKEIKRIGIDIDRIGNEAIIHMFDRYKKGMITKAAIGELLKQTPENEKDVERIIKESGLERMTGERLRSIVKKLGKKGRNEVTREIMTKYRFNVDGEELNRLLKKRA